MLGFFKVRLTCVKLKHTWPISKVSNCDNIMIHIRAQFARRNAHYTAAKAKTKEGGKLQKKREVPFFQACRKAEIIFLNNIKKPLSHPNPGFWAPLSTLPTAISRKIWLYSIKRYPDSVSKIPF